MLENLVEDINKAYEKLSEMETESAVFKAGEEYDILLSDHFLNDYGNILLEVNAEKGIPLFNLKLSITDEFENTDQLKDCLSKDDHNLLMDLISFHKENLETEDTCIALFKQPDSGTFVKLQFDAHNNEIDDFVEFDALVELK